MEQYYLQQINNNLELIRSDTEQIREITPIISTNLFNIKDNTQELVSGDVLTRQSIIDSNYRTSVYLGCINLILMVVLILSLLPARKGVLKKQ